MKYLYNVYDTEIGEQVLNRADNKSLCKYFEVNQIDTKRYCENDYLYRNRYRIERETYVDIVDRISETQIPQDFAQEWNKACKPFKRVIWVKMLEPGVKKLVDYKKTR